LPLEHVAEYDSAARWCAMRGIKGKIGDRLPDLMSPDGALKYISADPEAFQERIRQFAYAQAMEMREAIRTMRNPGTTSSTLQQCFDYATQLSRIDILNPDVWLVVDVGQVGEVDYRVWRERTVKENPPDYPYDLIAFANNGKLTEVCL